MPKFDALTSLVSLQLGGNADIDGSLPELTHMPKLTNLHAVACNLVGSVPPLPSSIAVVVRCVVVVVVVVCMYVCMYACMHVCLDDHHLTAIGFQSFDTRAIV
jgi:hypothetical protein